jgi:hypothetical protein
MRGKSAIPQGRKCGPHKTTRQQAIRAAKLRFRAD